MTNTKWNWWNFHSVSANFMLWRYSGCKALAQETYLPNNDMLCTEVVFSDHDRTAKRIACRNHRLINFTGKSEKRPIEHFFPIDLPVHRDVTRCPDRCTNSRSACVHWIGMPVESRFPYKSFSELTIYACLTTVHDGRRFVVHGEYLRMNSLEITERHHLDYGIAHVWQSLWPVREEQTVGYSTARTTMAEPPELSPFFHRSGGSQFSNLCPQRFPLLLNSPT